MTEPIPTAVIGVGYLGRFHAQKYQSLPQSNLIGVVDADPDRARSVGEELGVPAYTDPAAVLGEARAVSVAVPTGLHYEVVTACLDAGVHVLVEKPLTANAREAEALVAHAERVNRLLQVGHLERFNPAVECIRTLLGTPRFVEAVRIASFKERGLDVDVVLDLMSHDLDLLLSWVRSPLTDLHAVGVSVLTNHTDLANARLIFENGCVANLTASRISTKAERRVRVFQDDAYFSLDLAGPTARIYTTGAKPGERPTPQFQEESPELAPADALLLEITGFLDSVAGRQALVISGREGLAVVALAERIIEDIARNRPK